MIDLDTNSRTYKILDWIDNTARSLPPWTQLILLVVVLGTAFLFSLWLTHIIPYVLVGVW
jgi:hypothetical protein